MSNLEEMMASGMVKVFVNCEDCSKQKECGMRYSPGCCNWAGYRESMMDSKESNGKVCSSK